MAKTLKALGLCMGASTVSLVQVEQDLDAPGMPSPRIIHHSLHTHEGDPKRTLVRALAGLDMHAFDRIAATGRKFRRFVNLTSVSEPEAVETAYPFVKPPGVDCPAVVSAGGETFMVYVLDRTGRISNVVTGNKCASGTGEFFLQQLRRMNVSLEEATQWAAVETPHHVSGRCSVFCKSDCTHATNKGIPKAQVAAGLCKMMANKVLELLKKVERRDIMVVGGTAQNRMMIEYLREEIPGLVVPAQAPYLEALGAALWALSHETAPFTGVDALFADGAHVFASLAPLDDVSGMVEFKTIERGTLRPGDVCILGLDVGSTTTKSVLLRRSDHALLASVYLRTNGDPVGASRQCYRAIIEQVRRQVNPEAIRIAGLGVCGSGRQIAGLHALTDGVINEIIAHATAAVYFDPAGGHHFRNRRPGRQVHLHHQLGSLRLRHERSLLGGDGLLPGGIGPRDPRGENGGNRRDRLEGPAPPQLQRPVRRLHRLGHQERHPRGRGPRGHRGRPGVLDLHELRQPRQGQPARGRESLHAGRRVLQPRRAPGHGRPGRQTHHRPAGARPDGGLRCGARGPEADRKRPHGRTALRPRNPRRPRGRPRQSVHVPGRRRRNATGAAPSPSSRWSTGNTRSAGPATAITTCATTCTTTSTGSTW